MPRRWSRTSKAVCIVSIALAGVWSLRLIAQESDLPKDGFPTAEVKLPGAYRSEELGLEFTYPGDFLIGRYDAAGKPEQVRDMYASAIVLVEASHVGDHDLKRLPVGKLPAISIHRSTGKTAEFWRSRFDRKPWRTRIGEHDVVKMPYFPGPFGEKAFTYLILRPNGDVIRLVAHKYHPRRSEELTHYDWVIERIVATMSFSSGATRPAEPARP